MTELLECVQQRGTLEEVKTLVESGSDINYQDRNMMNALHWCAMYNESKFEETGIQIIQYLLDQGINVNSLDIKGKTPLMYFINRDCANSLISILLENGADVNCTSAHGYTALHYYSMMMQKNLQVCKALIEGLPNINVTGENGEIPLNCFLQHGSNKEYIKLLLDAGSDVTHRTVSGNTNLHLYAVWFHGIDSEDTDLEILKRLVGDGSLVNAKNASEATPLMWFLHFKLSLEHVRFLLVRGADVCARDEHGKSILHFAFPYLKDEYIGVIQILLEYGASLNAVTINHETPLSKDLHFHAAKAINLFYNYGLSRSRELSHIGHFLRRNCTYSKTHEVLFQHTLLEGETILDSYITPDLPLDYRIELLVIVYLLIQELKRMRRYIVAEELTLFDFLVENDPRKYTMLINKYSINSEAWRQEFPLYWHVLHSKLKIANGLFRWLSRIKYVSVSSRSKSGIGDRVVSLNLRFFQQVLQFLSHNDIKNLVLASVSR